MISNNNIKNILSSILTKSKNETDSQYNDLNTNMNKGWISSGTIADIQGTDTTNDTPVGSIIAHMGNTAPTHYLICDGTEYNIEDYTELANFFLEQFGSINYFGGDGTTTFAVPNLKGEFLRGAGANGHANCGSGASVGEHQIPTAHLAIHYNQYRYLTLGTTRASSSDTLGPLYGDTNQDVSHDTTNVPYNDTSKGSEGYYPTRYTARPTNTSVLYCIKYESTKLLGINLYDSTHYSEDEEIIGQWIDGKPLYRKVYTNISIGSSIVIDSSITTSNYTVCRIYGYFINSNADSSIINPIPYSNTSYHVTVGVNSNGLVSTTNYSSFYGRVMTVIIEYTKSTDTAFSVDEDIAWTALDSEVTDVINAIGE